MALDWRTGCLTTCSCYYCEIHVPVISDFLSFFVILPHTYLGWWAAQRTQSWAPRSQEMYGTVLSDFEITCPTRPHPCFLYSSETSREGDFWFSPLGHGIFRWPIFKCMWSSPGASFSGSHHHNYPLGHDNSWAHRLAWAHADGEMEYLVQTSLPPNSIEFQKWFHLFEGWLKRWNYLFHCPYDSFGVTWRHCAMVLALLE